MTCVGKALHLNGLSSSAWVLSLPPALSWAPRFSVVGTMAPSHQTVSIQEWGGAGVRG